MRGRVHAINTLKGLVADLRSIFLLWLFKHHPHTCINLAFMPNDASFLHCRQIAFYRTLCHRQCFRHFFLTSSSCHPRKISHPIFLNENAIFEQPLVWEYESAILLSFFRVTQGINQSIDYQTLISLLQKSDEVRVRCVTDNVSDISFPVINGFFLIEDKINR